MSSTGLDVSKHEPVNACLTKMHSTVHQPHAQIMTVEHAVHTFVKPRQVLPPPHRSVTSLALSGIDHLLAHLR